MTVVSEELTADGEREAIAALEREIAEERLARRNRNRQRIGRWVLGAIALVVLHFVLDMNILPWIFVFMGGGAVAEAVRSSKRELANTVSQTTSPGAAGALALAYASEDEWVRRAAKKGLKRLLPDVRAEHRTQISADGMTAIRKLLHAGPDLAHGALLALGEIGGEDALSDVNGIARGDYRWLDKSTVHTQTVPVEELQRTALEAHRRITGRVEKEKERARLLRPAEAGGEELLRRPFRAEPTRKRC